MKKQFLLKMCFIIVTGIVALFWLIDLATTHTKEDMSYIDIKHRNQITAWGLEAERLYLANDENMLKMWLQNLRETEKTSVSIVQSNVESLVGDAINDIYLHRFNLGRDVNWKIHLYFEENPVMEVPFSHQQISFLIKLPDRMRPGSHINQAWFTLKVFLPMVLLIFLSIILYRHIMIPLRQLERATQRFSQGDFDVRVRQLLGKRDDEISDLATTFDHMAVRIGEQIVNQRQLISDLSHELRTPLTRLDISIHNIQDGEEILANIERIQRESTQIRTLIDDSLTLAWLENERPELQQESLDLVDLLDVLIDDARFEFLDRTVQVDLPNDAEIHNSNHRSLGQAFENIIRNALRFTPPKQVISISLIDEQDHYTISICDQGPGVPKEYLEMIFQPFFRVDSSRPTSSNSFGLGLALARRQIMTVGGVISATNIVSGGLMMNIKLPKH